MFTTKFVFFVTSAAIALCNWTGSRTSLLQFYVKWKVYENFVCFIKLGEVNLCYLIWFQDASGCFFEVTASNFHLKLQIEALVQFHNLIMDFPIPREKLVQGAAERVWLLVSFKGINYGLIYKKLPRSYVI